MDKGPVKSDYFLPPIGLAQEGDCHSFKGGGGGGGAPSTGASSPAGISTPTAQRPEAPKTPSSQLRGSRLAQHFSIRSFPAISSFLSGEGTGARET